MKRMLCAGLVLLMALAAVAAGTELKKLSTYGWKGQSDDVTMVLDVDVARYRGGEKYFPIVVFLGNSSRKTIHADRGSFVLTDPTGAKLALPSAEELQKAYSSSLIGGDYTMIRRLPDYASSVFLAQQYISKVCFFPNPGGVPGILYDHVELPNLTYCNTLLYFPNPAGKAAGNYTLTYDDPKSKTHIEVPFPVDWQK